MLRNPKPMFDISRRRLAALAWLLALACLPAQAETIAGARYADPVGRYGHFAPGRPHEYARLVATTDAGRELALALPEDEVFEDVAPRLVRLGGGAPAEILAIVSHRARGSRLALLGLEGGALAIAAQSAPIGTPMRWMNPVGAADLDGDGTAEIGAVVTPHIGGTLVLYRRRGAALAPVASLAGFSNHVYGSAELALSAPFAAAPGMRLLVPDATRTQLRVIALVGGRLVETGRCALGAPAIGPLRAVSPREVSMVTTAGTKVVAPTECAR